MALPALLLLVSVVLANILAAVISSIPGLAMQVLLPPHWLLWAGAAALATWLSGGE